MENVRSTKLPIFKLRATWPRNCTNYTYAYIAGMSEPQ